MHSHNRENRFMVGLDVGLDDGEGGGPQRRHRRNSLAGLPAPRDQAAREDPRISAPHRDGSRCEQPQHTHVRHRVGRRRAGRAGRREICAGSDGGGARGGEAASGGVFGHRAGRAGRQDHRLQGRQRKRPQEKNPVDERQVRRRHWRGDRQDQRQAENSRRGTQRAGLPRHQAAQSGGQVRRLRRDRHQQPAESGHAARPADGLAV